MSRGQCLLIGLLLSLGLAACSQSVTPTEYTKGFPTPELLSFRTITPSTTPSKPSASPTVLLTEPKPTKTKPTASIPTESTPSITPTTQVDCWDDGGRIEIKQLESDWLPDPLDYRVYTPPCYDQQSDRYFPVLFLIHGQSFREDQWERLGAGEIADTLIAAGELTSFIMVMPRDSQDRTPPPENQFGEALLFDLIPRIDGDYRTIPDRRFRAIGGISRGGNWAIHLGLTYWGFFGSVGAHSTPTFIADGPKVIQKWLAEIPFDELPRLYLDTGKNDTWLASTLQFEQILDDEGIPHEWYLFPGHHDEKYWAAHMEQYIRWYAAIW